MRRRVLTVATGLFLAITVAAALAGPGDNDPVGACCLGADVAVVISISSSDCRLLANGKTYKWVKGDFNIGDDKSPCIEGAVD